MLVRVMDITYTKDEENYETIVKMAGRSANGNRIVKRIYGKDPYGFYPAREPTPDFDCIVDADDGYKSYDGTWLKKIKTQFPKPDTNNVKDEFTADYEADIPFYRRCMIDGLSGYVDVPRGSQPISIDEVDTDPDTSETIDPRICIADIEVKSSDKTFDEMAEQVADPIIAITMWDSYEDCYYAMVLDPQKDVKGQDVRDEMNDHWGDDEQYKGVDVALTTYDAERDLLLDFIKKLGDIQPDLVSGWNYVSFDWMYLLHRIDGFGLKDRLSSYVADLGRAKQLHFQHSYDRVVEGLPAFDMMQAYDDPAMTQSNWRSTALDYIAEDKLGIGKVDDVSVSKEYEERPSRLVAYNIIDVQLCVELDNQYSIHELFYSIADQSSIHITDTMYSMRRVDGYIMSRRNDHEVLPSQDDKHIEPNAGGLVLDPANDLYENVGTLDVKSLYPSSMVTWNISPETITMDPDDDYDVIVPSVPESLSSAEQATDDKIGWTPGEEFCVGVSMDHEGVVPKYVKRMFGRRESQKASMRDAERGSAEEERWDIRQSTTKIIMNTAYGVLSSDYFRLGVPGLADAVTSAARYVLWKGAESIHGHGNDVTYGDTDSCLTPLGDDSTQEEVVDAGKQLESVVNDDMDAIADNIGLDNEHPYLPDDLHGTDRHCIVWEFESLFSSFLQMGSKKRYCGLRSWDEGEFIDPPELKTKGFESRRSDVPEKAEEVQNTVFRMILEGQGFAAISEYVQDIIDGFRSGDVGIMEFATPGVLNKPISEYPNGPVPDGSSYSNENLDAGFGPGDEPWIVPVKHVPVGQPGTSVIALSWNEDVPEGFEPDKQKMIEKAIKQPISSVLGAMGWTWGEIKSGKKTASIEMDSDETDILLGNVEPNDDDGDDETGVLGEW